MLHKFALSNAIRLLLATSLQRDKMDHVRKRAISSTAPLPRADFLPGQPSPTSLPPRPSFPSLPPQSPFPASLAKALSRRAFLPAYPKILNALSWERRRGGERASASEAGKEAEAGGSGRAAGVGGRLGKAARGENRPAAGAPWNS